MLPAQPANVFLVERAPTGGPVTSVVETFGELGVGVGGAKLAQQVANGDGTSGAGGGGPQNA